MADNDDLVFTSNGYESSAGSSAFIGMGRQNIDAVFPSGQGLTRNEKFLVEYQGIIHSEAEEIFYGLEGCGLLSFYPFKRYHEIVESLMTPMEIYREIAFFRPDDLLVYLNDDNPIPESRLGFARNYCKINYTFSPSTLTSFAGALKGIIDKDFLKSVTFVFPNSETYKDRRYIRDLYGEQVLESKASILVAKEGQSVAECMRREMLEAQEADDPYTTVVTNEYQFIIECLKNFEILGCEETFFLLRNHSQNMIMHSSVNSDGIPDATFEEIGTKEIETLINPMKDRLINKVPAPLSTKFARFSPLPFNK